MPKRSPFGSTVRSWLGYSAILTVAIAAASLVCRADMIGDPTIRFSFSVPKAPDKADPGGWGFLTLTFDRPITFGTFVFLPDCPADRDPPNPEGLVSVDGLHIQIGPGRYGLGQTGIPSDSGKGNYQTLDITINYPDPADPPPRIILQQGSEQLSFWKFKGGGEFNFNGESAAKDQKDQPLNMFDAVSIDGRDPSSFFVPTPSALAGGLALVPLLWLGKRLIRIHELKI